MKRLRRLAQVLQAGWSCVLLLGVGHAGVASAQEIGPGVAEVRACIEKSLPRSGKQRVRLERTDRAGKTRSLEAIAYWKPGADNPDFARFLVRIEAPPDERGSAFLMLEREGGSDIWTYLPELRTVRRISDRAVSGSFFGTDFTYEDVVALQDQSESSKIEKLPDAEVDGRPVWVLSAVPKDGAASDYSRVVSSVDRETCVVLQAQFFGKSDELVKEVRVAPADVEKQGDLWRPRKIALRDLAKGSESRLIFEKGDWSAEVPDRFFSQTELAKGR